MISASLISRILAAITDAAIVLLLLSESANLAYLASRFMSLPRSSLSGAGMAALIGLPVVALLVLLAVPLYYALFEASKWRATPGKRLFGLIVLSADGTRLSFKDALLARLIYWLPFLVFPLGHLFMPVYALAQLALAGIVAGIVCDKSRRSAADFVCRRFVAAAPAKGLDPVPQQELTGLARLPMPLFVLVPLSLILLAPTVTFSFGQIGNYFYRTKIAIWRDKNLYKKGKIVFVERTIIGATPLSGGDLAEFDAIPDSLPPDAIVCAAAVVGKPVAGIVSEGSVLTLDHFEKTVAAQIEEAEKKCQTHSNLSGIKDRVMVYRWRDTVKHGQLVTRSDIEPAWIDEEQFTDSMCFAPWQIVGRIVSDRCQALRRDIVHSQYIDVPSRTVAAQRSMHKGEVIESSDITSLDLNAKQKFYTAVSAPQLVLGSRLLRDVEAGEALRYSDFAMSDKTQ
jgi:uncharacterized RDD family membrane protein YckC